MVERRVRQAVRGAPVRFPALPGRRLQRDRKMPPDACQHRARLKIPSAAVVLPLLLLTLVLRAGTQPAVDAFASASTGTTLLVGTASSRRRRRRRRRRIEPYCRRGAIQHPEIKLSSELLRGDDLTSPLRLVPSSVRHTSAASTALFLSSSSFPSSLSTSLRRYHSTSFSCQQHHPFPHKNRPLQPYAASPSIHHPAQWKDPRGRASPATPGTRRHAASSSSDVEGGGGGRTVSRDETKDDEVAGAAGNWASRMMRRRTRHGGRIVLPTIVQLAVTLLCYGFHMAFLTTNSVTFPFQLIPNAKGHFCGITYDSLVGMSVLVGYLAIVRPRRIRNQLRSQMMKSSNSMPRAAADDRKPHEQDEGSTSPSLGAPPPFLQQPFPMPWNLPIQSVRWRVSSLVALGALVQAYFYAGRFSLFWEDTILNLSGLGFYITAPISRSLQVLMGHLTWVAIGSALLRWIPRPPAFFRGNTAHHTSATSSDDHPGDELTTLASSGIDSNPTSTRDSTAESAATAHHWFQLNVRRSNWLLWTIGGYCVSSFLFNMADGINQYVVPSSLLLDQQETSVVSQLVTPEHNDVVASVLAYLAPCVTAPWWEEILYRGFLLPVLSSAFGYPIAVFLQSIVFSAHHMSLTAFVPLLVLGLAWGVLYRECRNLWVPILIHAMWNSRVFFTSWLGI